MPVLTRKGKEGKEEDQDKLERFSFLHNLRKNMGGKMNNNEMQQTIKKKKEKKKKEWYLIPGNANVNLYADFTKRCTSSLAWQSFLAFGG